MPSSFFFFFHFSHTKLIFKVKDCKCVHVHNVKITQLPLLGASFCKQYSLVSATPRMGNGTREETSCAACKHLQIYCLWEMEKLWLFVILTFRRTKYAWLIFMSRWDYIDPELEHWPNILKERGDGEDETLCSNFKWMRDI